jgi:hypothetical protein
MRYRVNRQQIEAIVLEAYDRRAKGSSDEDSWVEFKAKPPQGDWSKEQWWKLARVVAALANSARGESVFLVFEDPETDLDHSELWSRLWTAFDDGVHPHEIATFEIAVNDHVRVLAAALETDRFPYVVQVHTGKDESFKPLDFWDVPFRKNTKAVSGRRHDLARMVLPMSRRPTVEAGLWTVGFESHSRRGDHSLFASLAVTLVPSSLSPCYLLPELKGKMSWGAEALVIHLQVHIGGTRVTESPELPPARMVTLKSDCRFRGEKPSRETPVLANAILRFEPGGLLVRIAKELPWSEGALKWCSSDPLEPDFEIL